jgi:hypothetical protein
MRFEAEGKLPNAARRRSYSNQGRIMMVSSVVALEAPVQQPHDYLRAKSRPLT